MAMISGIGQNLKPFTGNGDDFIWMKNSQVECNTSDKQINKQNNHDLGHIL